MSWLMFEFYFSDVVTQFVFEPTRLGNTLDLVLSNDANLIYNVEIDAPFSTSDYDIVSFSLVCDVGVPVRDKILL